MIGSEIGDGAQMDKFGNGWIWRWSLAGIRGLGSGRDRLVWVLRLERWSLAKEMVRTEDGYKDWRDGV